MLKLDTFHDLAALAGQDVAVTDWVTVTQEQINLFAEATGDRQWIHIDEARAQAGPFGSTIAHGFLTLSLIPQFLAGAVAVREPGTAVNYGLNKVRFMAPVPVGSQLRARLRLLSCDEVEPALARCLQMVWQVQMERAGADKPVCVEEPVIRYYPGLG